MCTTKKSFKHVSLYVIELLKTLFHTPTSVLVGVILQFWFLMSTRTPTVYVNRVFRIVNHSNRVLFYIRCYSGFKNFFSISFGSKVMIQNRYSFILICDYTLITLLSIVAGISGDIKMIPVISAIDEEQTIVCLGLWLLFLVTGGSDIDAINSARVK